MSRHGRAAGQAVEHAGGRSFPISSEAEGLLEDLVHAVVDWPRSSAAEGIGPQYRGMNLTGLRQDGPLHVVDHREEGPEGIGHLTPRRPRPRVGGRLAGGVVVPDPAPPVHPHGVVPAGGRRPLEEGEAAARAEEPAGRGVVPPLHTAGSGLPPQRLARLLLPHGGQELAPRVQVAAAAGSGRGARAKRTWGYLHCRAWPTVAPLVPNSGLLGRLTAVIQTSLSSGR